MYCISQLKSHTLIEIINERDEAYILNIYIEFICVSTAVSENLTESVMLIHLAYNVERWNKSDYQTIEFTAGKNTESYYLESVRRSYVGIFIIISLHLAPPPASVVRYFTRVISHGAAIFILILFELHEFAFDFSKIKSYLKLDAENMALTTL